MLAALLAMPAAGHAAPASEQAATAASADQIRQSREAAARYADFEAALADGYERLFECTDNGAEGAMGNHYVHPDRLGDKRLALAEPDVLMYERQPDGSMQLVAVEYAVFEKDWPHRQAPSLLGQRLKRKTAVGRNPVDPFYEIHFWHWRHNPAGFFADWNANVTCDHASD